MKILAIARSTTQHSLSGGMEQQYESLIEGLIADGHQVSLLTTEGLLDEGSLPAYSNIWLAAGGNGRYTPSWWLMTARRRKPWRSEDWDLILSVSFAGGMACSWRGVAPVVAQIHGTAFAEVLSSSKARTVREAAKMALNTLRILREKWFLSRFRSVIAISDAVESQLRAFPYRLPRGAVSVVPNGVAPVDGGEIRRRRALKRAELGVGDEEVVVAFSGRLHPQKGLSDAIRAFREVSLGRLLIAGSGPGAAEAEAAALADPRIAVLGRLARNDLESVYAAADLLVFPSKRKEGLPMVLLESAAWGLPVVAYEGCGVPADLFPGLTLIPANVNQLASRMTAALPREETASLLPNRFRLADMISGYEDRFEEARLRAR